MKLEIPTKEFRTVERVRGSVELHGAINTRYNRKLLSGSIRGETEKLVKQFFKERENYLSLLDLQVAEAYIYLIFRCHGRASGGQVLLDLRRDIGPKLREKFPQLKSKVPTMWSPDVYLSSAGQPMLEHLLEYSASQKA